MLALVSLLSVVVAPASATSGTQTLRAGGSDGYSPDSERDKFNVEATSLGGVANGTLSTSGKVSGEVGGTFALFEGGVTCMLVEGDRAVVGAVGSVALVGPGPGATPVPGVFGQLLSIERGDFPDSNLEEPTSYTFRFQMLGEHDEGVEGMTAPNCAMAAVPSSWLLPTFGGFVELTPEPPPAGEVIVKSSEGSSSGGGGSSSGGAPGSQATPLQSAPGQAPRSGAAAFTARRLTARIASVKVSRRHAKVTFTSAGGLGRVTFVCRLDGKPLRRCASPMRLRTKPGRHHFSVAAVGTGTERSALVSTSIDVR
ncbi:MAG TPA: hypothetical protein VK761_02755 [Solirubrobacteraceae bacterium]|jgi:hypothetical protein|nr:hypothetical protein [Solirubrobacteraceae bacterium]